MKSLVTSEVEIDMDKLHERAMNETMKELKQGFQAMEIAFNTLPSSRGDFVFVTYTFGLGQDKWARMVSKAIMDVRNGGQGKAKIPQLFPKLVYLYDKDLHGKGHAMREDFEYAVYCQSQTMFPDLLSLTPTDVRVDKTGNYFEVYEKYGVATSPINKTVA